MTEKEKKIEEDSKKQVKRFWESKEGELVKTSAYWSAIISIATTFLFSRIFKDTSIIQFYWNSVGICLAISGAPLFVFEYAAGDYLGNLLKKYVSIAYYLTPIIWLFWGVDRGWSIWMLYRAAIIIAAIIWIIDFIVLVVKK